MAGFWSSLPYHTLVPNQTTVMVPDAVDLVSATLSDPERALVVAYVATEATGRNVEGIAATLRLPPGKYSLGFISPADGKVIETREHVSRHIKETPQVPLPAFTDDLAIRIDRLEKHERTMIPGTQ